MEEKKAKLKHLLENVPDTYADFSNGVFRAAKTDEIVDGLIEFMTNKPDATSSQVTVRLEELEGIR